MRRYTQPGLSLRTTSRTTSDLKSSLRRRGLRSVLGLGLGLTLALSPLLPAQKSFAEDATSPIESTGSATSNAPSNPSADVPNSSPADVGANTPVDSADHTSANGSDAVTNTSADTSDTAPASASGDDSIDAPSNSSANAEETAPASNTEQLQLVALSIQDGGVVSPQIRYSVDTYAYLVTKHDGYALKIRFFSERFDTAGYEHGTPTIRYAFSEDGEKTEATARVIESGTIGGSYKISEAEIPLTKEQVDSKTPVYLYGQFTATQATDIRYEHFGIARWETSDKSASDEVGSLTLLNFSQGANREVSKLSLPLDFEHNGKYYSPYTSVDGTKFSYNDGLPVEVNFARESFTLSGLRHIHFTVDGTEPTQSSAQADLKNLNKDSILPSHFFRLYLNNELIETAESFKKDHTITLKVRGFNKDYTQSTETLTYTVPYAEKTVNKVSLPADNILNSELSLSTGSRSYALPESAHVRVAAVEDGDQATKINELAASLGITPTQILRFTLLEGSAHPSAVETVGSSSEPSGEGSGENVGEALAEGSSEGSSEEQPLELRIPNSWNNLSKNPKTELTIKQFGSKTTRVYHYNPKKQTLTLVPYQVVGKRYTLALNQQDGVYVVASKEGDPNEEARELLTKEVEAAKTFIAENPNSRYVSFIQAEIDNAEKILKRKKVSTAQGLNARTILANYLEAAAVNTEENLELIHKKVDLVKETLASDIVREVFTPEAYAKLQALLSDLDKAKESITVAEAESLIAPAVEILTSRAYQGVVEEVEVALRHADREEDSMANGTLNPKAKLITIDGVRYIELGFHTMLVGNLRAHLLHPYVYSERADASSHPDNSSKAYPTAVLDVYEDVSAYESNVTQYFPGLCLVKILDTSNSDADGASDASDEGSTDVKDVYWIAAANDGMGGAAPAARLRIRRSADTTTPPTDTSEADPEETSETVSPEETSETNAPETDPKEETEETSETTPAHQPDNNSELEESVETGSAETDSGETPETDLGKDSKPSAKETPELASGEHVKQPEQEPSDRKTGANTGQVTKQTTDQTKDQAANQAPSNQSTKSSKLAKTYDATMMSAGMYTALLGLGSCVLAGVSIYKRGSKTKR